MNLIDKEIFLMVKLQKKIRFLLLYEVKMSHFLLHVKKSMKNPPHKQSTYYVEKKLVSFYSNHGIGYLITLQSKPDI